MLCHFIQWTIKINEAVGIQYNQNRKLEAPVIIIRAQWRKTYYFQKAWKVIHDFISPRESYSFSLFARKRLSIACLFIFQMQKMILVIPKYVFSAYLGLIIGMKWHSNNTIILTANFSEFSMDPRLLGISETKCKRQCRNFT